MGVEVSDLEASRWTIDPVHSEITFTIRHLMSTVRGSFPDFGGEVVIGDDPLDSTARAEIRMGSIDTRSAERDEHVRSADFLDVRRHPVMMFAATGVERATVGRRARSPRYHLDGDLTIKDVTRPVRLLTEFHGVGPDPWGGTRAASPRPPPSAAATSASSSTSRCRATGSCSATRSRSAWRSRPSSPPPDQRPRPTAVVLDRRPA